MNVIRAILAVGLASAVIVSSVDVASASGARHRSVHAAGRHYAHRGHARVLARGAFGAPASAYLNDTYYGGPAYGFFGAPTYGYYRGVY